MKKLSLILGITLLLAAVAGCSEPDISAAGLGRSTGLGRSVSASSAPAEEASSLPTSSPQISVRTEVASETSEPPRETAAVVSETAVWSALSDAEQIGILSVGQEVEIVDIPETFWCEIKTGALSGYAYTGNLQRDGGTLLAHELNEKIAAFEDEYSNGRYWNHMGYEAEGYYPYTVTDIPCEHSDLGYDYCNYYDGATLLLFPQYASLTQCFGFASLMSDSVFGETAPISTFYDAAALHIGDQIRFTYYEHSVTVIGMDESSVTVAECNRNYDDCLIEWGRVITFDELKTDYGYGGAEYITRYPAEPSPNERTVIYDEYQNY